MADQRNQIELAIARLERSNVQLKKILNLASEQMSEADINEFLDQILINEGLIAKLKRGL